MDNNHIKINNYNLSFGDLGVQFKFNKDVSEKDIKTVMYYFEQHVSQLDSDFKICSILFENAKKDVGTIDTIQN